MSDNHPLIKRQAAWDYFPADEEVDPADFVELQCAKLMLHAPQDRVAAIQALDQAIAADEGNLRERAQLMELRRRMAGTHENLLRVRR